MPTISISGDVYERFHARCTADRITMAARLRDLTVDIVGDEPTLSRRATRPRGFYPSDARLRKRYLVIVTPERHAQIHAIAKRERRSAADVLDGAINAMLDSLESGGAKRCAA